MGPRGQTPGLIQPPLWGDISRLTPGQAVLTRRILPVVSIGGYPAAGAIQNECLVSNSGFCVQYL